MIIETCTTLEMVLEACTMMEMVCKRIVTLYSGLGSKVMHLVMVLISVNRVSNGHRLCEDSWDGEMAHAIRWHVMGKISIPWMPWHATTFYARHIGLHTYVEVTWMEMGVMAERYILVTSCWDGVQLRKLFWWHHAAVARISPLR